MTTYQGEVSSLGNSITNRAITTYSVIEIGDQILQKIKVPNSLDNFLVKSLKQGGTTKLHIRGSMILGVTLNDGKTYCYKAKPFFGVVLLVIGIPFIPFFGVGLIYIWQGFAELMNHRFSKELANQGATQISL